MTNCPTCQRNTSPVINGGQSYCSICGSLTDTDKSIIHSRRSTLDLSPRVLSPAPSKVNSNEPHRNTKSAEALHRRVKPSRILDLRGTSPKPANINPNLDHTLANPPASTTHERHLAHINQRLTLAKQVERSPEIGKFSKVHLGSRPQPIHEQTVTLVKQVDDSHQTSLPQLAATHHEAMTKLPLVLPADSTPHTQNAQSWRPNLRLSPHTSQVATTVAAMVLMSGYIWLQNYPKFALQNASSKAGISATLPAYLPSSYNLASTTTSSGLVTLNFSSPSASDKLVISQHHSDWDSSSLLDNFVAKNADDYATVQGQGLTIYLFNNNRATWVNRGIWYSIDGASRLSREQILKIAYSL